MKRFELNKFRQYLTTAALGHDCIYLDTVDSTSNHLKEMASENLKEGTVCIADEQLAGRGQYHRKWETSAYKNLTFTICFKPGESDRLPLLTLTCAHAILQTLEKYVPGERLHLKWPNDLMADGKKIAGVLTEATFFGPLPEKVLVGIGLNIFEDNFHTGIRGKSVSLSEISNEHLIREKILAEALLNIEYDYQLWKEKSALLQKKINNRLEGYGQWNKITLNGDLQAGEYKFIGLGPSGELLLLNEALDVITFRHEQIRIITGQASVSRAAPKIR